MTEEQKSIYEEAAEDVCKKLISDDVPINERLVWEAAAASIIREHFGPLLKAGVTLCLTSWGEYRKSTMEDEYKARELFRAAKERI